jgi:hypothetical protein
MTTATHTVQFDDPVNAAILAVSEDELRGFQRDPLGEIARRSGIELPVVVERIRSMLQAGIIRRVRQTLIATNLAPGALVAWRIPADKLDAAFDYMCQRDPFTGHVVIRTTDAATPAADYKLWTTVKVPQGYSVEKHAAYLAAHTAAEQFRLMPARCLFALGVGHIRRRGIPPGSKSQVPAQATDVKLVVLSDLEWRVLGALKREFTAQEIGNDLWRPRADEAGVPLDTFFEIAESLGQRNLMGHFSTFLEHTKAVVDGQSVTQYNALFHWAAAPGREIEAGREIARHHILTHCYWRETGPEFQNVNIMAVAHGTDRDLLLEHKAAIDAHLESVGIPVSHSSVFWGGRSQIKPSEVLPDAYRGWCRTVGLDPDAMRE